MKFDMEGHTIHTYLNHFQELLSHHKLVLITAASSMVIMCIVVLYFTSQNNQSNPLYLSSLATPTVSMTPSIASTASITIPSTQITQSDILHNFYTISLTRKPNSPTPTQATLGQYFVQLFSLPDYFKTNLDITEPAIFYNLANGSPKNMYDSFTYYVLLFTTNDQAAVQSGDLDPTKQYITPGKTYEDSSFSVSVTAADPSLLPYFTANAVDQYCVSDNQCSIRSDNGCDLNKSAYNGYHWIGSHLTSCTAPYAYGTIIPSYSGAICQNNLCTPQ